MITLTGGNIQDGKGNLLNGNLTLQLTADASVIATPGLVVRAIPVTFQFANGNLVGSCKCYSNAELTPGTQYQVSFADKNNSRLGDPILWQFSQAAGSTVDIGTMVAVGGGVSYPQPVLLNPTGSQVIASGNLSLSVGDFNAVLGTYRIAGVAPTGTGPLVAQTGATLITPGLGVATATSINKIVFTQPVTAATLTLANNSVLTGQATGTIVNKDSTDILTNKDLTGVATGNKIGVLNAQGTVGPLTGNSADQVIYTFTLLANTIDSASKGITITAACLHASGTVNTTLKINVNGVAVVTGTTGTTASQSCSLQGRVLRTAATTAGVFGLAPAATGNNGTIVSFSQAITGLAWGSNQTITLTFNVANTDTFTGIMFLVEQNQ